MMNFSKVVDLGIYAILMQMAVIITKIGISGSNTRDVGFISIALTCLC